MVGDFEIARSVSEIIEAVAITAISFAVVLAVAVGIVEMVRWEWNTAFQRFKRYTALGLLVGLDLLVAAGIIETVQWKPLSKTCSYSGCWY